jgi:hypothetical protein
MRGPLIFLGVVVLAGGAVLALRSPQPGTVAVSASATAPPDAAADASATSAALADGEMPVMTVYRAPTCGCCGDWIEHMRAAGFTVEVENVSDLVAVKSRLGVPSDLGSCHTGVIGDYLVEGHVPADDVKRMLAEGSDVAGLAVPGMPIGSPGMDVPGQPAQPFEVMVFDSEGGRTVFARH